MRKLRLAILPSLAVAIAMLTVPITYVSYNCPACRLYKTVPTLLGIQVSSPSYFQNDLSQFYQDHMDPSHTHSWALSSHATNRNLLGMTMGTHSLAHRNPINRLNPSTQLRFYQAFSDPMIAKRICEDIATNNLHDEWMHDQDFYRGDLAVMAIYEWESKGFPGTWDEWRQRYLVKRPLILPVEGFQ